MKKLRLDVEALAVEAFDAGSGMDGGTVQGMSLDSGCGCPDTGPKCPAPAPSEAATCPNPDTCQPQTCYTPTTVGTCCP